MKRVNKILNNKTFNVCLDNINQNELNRIYCKHGIEHLLDVARIMHISSLEKNLKVEKELIYAVALLHDIGRADLSEQNHAISSAKIAREILNDCDFIKPEIDLIENAIFNHREKGETDCEFGKLLFTADKNSRNCFCCNARATCSWNSEQMNKEIIT